MLRQKPELNIIYISERMRHSLQPVARSSLTAVVAPMGYGKTTAINWYLNERGREGAAVLRVSIYSANRQHLLGSYRHPDPSVWSVDPVFHHRWRRFCCCSVHGRLPARHPDGSVCRWPGHFHCGQERLQIF